MRNRLAVVASAAALAASLVGAQGAEARKYIPGIDVSNLQEDIDWKGVADSDKVEFAFVKASESTDFVDIWYESNRAGAALHDIELGAYHYARPTGGGRKSKRRDARAEAKHFLSIAQPRSGDLLPVLDLEETGGLGPGSLAYWTRKWLQEVTERLGVNAIIYTSPSFWREHLGDSTWFADNGYKTLWIAHWEARKPDVPANNWEGKGWTFWQWTDCGSVSGIEGCVDRDRYDGGDFSPVQIP